MVEHLYSKKGKNDLSYILNSVTCDNLYAGQSFYALSVHYHTSSLLLGKKSRVNNKENMKNFKQYP